MKTKFLVIFGVFLLKTSVYSQCTVGVTPDVIFYPNTITNYSVFTGIHRYLCGPNTIVTDTVKSINSFCAVYMNPNTRLVFSAGQTPMAPPGIYVKNTASLTVLPGSAYVDIYAEPNAVLSLPPGTTAITCPNISFPSVNCVEGIMENLNNDFFKVWPSPASSKLNFNLSSVPEQHVDIVLYNQVGEVFRSFSNLPSNQNEITVEDLPNGSYYIIVRINSIKYTHRFIVLH